MNVVKCHFTDSAKISVVMTGKHVFRLTAAATTSNCLNNSIDNKSLLDNCNTNDTVIKSRIMRWAGHVARIAGEHRCIQCFGGGT